MIVFDNFPSTQANIFTSLTYSGKTQSVVACMESMIMGSHPFSFFEQNVIRRNFWLSTISVDALMSYMSFVTNIVEQKVKAKLPDNFTIIFEGWTGGDSQYVSEFATFPSDQTKGFKSVMLEIASIGHESSQSADEDYPSLSFLCTRKALKISLISSGRMQRNIGRLHDVLVHFSQTATHTDLTLLSKTSYESIFQKVQRLMKKRSF